jgi:hypothetical protein
VEIRFEIRRNNTGLERRETRPLRDGAVEVDEALGNKVCLFAAVGALFSRGVHERDVGTDETVTGTPLRRICRNVAKEDEHGKALTKLVLLEMNAGRPVLYDVRGRLSGSWVYSCMRGASSAGERMNGSRSSRRRGRSSGCSCNRGLRWSSASSRRLGKEAYSRSGSKRRSAVFLVDYISDRIPNRRGVAWKIVEFRIRVFKRAGCRGSRRDPVARLRVPERCKV